MQFSHFLLACSTIQYLPSVTAWGTLGHDTIALIAENFVAAKTETYCKDILNDTSDTYLESVATWADSYRYTAAGKFSAPFHYIDAEDDPPHACNVDFQRDCGEGGCVVSAISNYTARLHDTSLSADEKQQALKFIVHFVGDIHQPLHDEALDVGGNTINVTFDGTITNLHHIWDTNIPEKLIGGYTLTFAESWAANLTTELKTGKYKSEKAAWLDGTSLNDTTATGMVWARDSNAFVCTAVMPNGVAAVETSDLGGAYYSSVIDVVELQIAKAGYRLAAWLNLIASGTIGLPTKSSSMTAEPISLYPRGQLSTKLSNAKLARRAFGDGCGCGEH